MRRTVLIVDDHEAFRQSASALLEAEGFDVVGQAADGPEAIAQAERLRPQVVLLDIQLPDLDGFAVAERLAGLPDAPGVVLISSREASAYGPRLGEASARGFITKPSSRARRSRRSWAERRCERSGCGCGRPARRSESPRSGCTSIGRTAAAGYRIWRPDGR